MVRPCMCFLLSRPKSCCVNQDSGHNFSLHQSSCTNGNASQRSQQLLELSQMYCIPYLHFCFCKLLCISWRGVWGKWKILYMSLLQAALYLFNLYIIFPTPWSYKLKTYLKYNFTVVLVTFYGSHRFFINLCSLKIHIQAQCNIRKNIFLSGKKNNMRPYPG